MTNPAQARAPSAHEGRVVMQRDDHGYTSGYQAHCDCGWHTTTHQRPGLALHDLLTHHLSKETTAWPGDASTTASTTTPRSEA